jgi:ribosomal protein S18 acetylase RimI-like enzyme
MIEDGFAANTRAAFAAEFHDEYRSPEHFRARLEELKARPGSVFLVARERNALSGFLFVTPRAPAKLRHTADLNMGVRREAHGRGIGSELVAAALARLQTERIIEIVYLMVRADNATAVRLYEKAGFERLATLVRDTRIGPNYFDGILMRKDIA